jgi:serine/threonine protein kinase
MVAGVGQMEDLEAGDPRQIGPYAISARLGAGGMGQVFLGRSQGGRLVAVKVIHPEWARDKEFRARFAREVAVARTVGGFFTAPVVDADTEAAQPWLATGFVDGPSLAAAVAEHGPMPEQSLLALAAGLAEGLSAVHAAGVVHRDLKPSNVLLARDGLRVMDFGIAQAADSTALTGTGRVIGSPSYMSPEQAQGRGVTAASDVFSMGSVVVYAATGTPPFGAGSAPEQLFRVVYDSPKLDSLPASLYPLITRCMGKDPAGRPSARQFLAELPRATPVAQPRSTHIDWWPAPAWAPAATDAAVPGPMTPAPPRTPDRPAAWVPADRAVPFDAVPFDAVPVNAVPAAAGPAPAATADTLPPQPVPVFTGPAGPTQDVAGLTGAGSGGAGAGGGRKGGAGSRRVPIVTTVSVVFALMVAGGLFGSWQYVQGQYYLGIDHGYMAIFRGVDTSVAGVSLSSLYQRTSIPVAQLPANAQVALGQGITSKGLSDAQAVVTSIRAVVGQCREQWHRLAAWKAANDAYQQKLALYNQVKAHLRPGVPPPAPPVPPGPRPPVPAAASCGPAAAFGIPASALPLGTSGAGPATTPSATPTIPVSTPRDTSGAGPVKSTHPAGTPTSTRHLFALHIAAHNGRKSPYCSDWDLRGLCVTAARSWGGVGMEELQAGDPQRIGPYMISARLGAGGMGRVYLGRSQGGRFVAVKVIHAELAGDPAFRKKFAREVAAARTVGGFFTAPVVDADTEAAQPWLATGYVDGPTLAKAMAEHGPMPEQSLLVLAAGLAEGLSAVHAAGVVHRDLKPSNVLLARDGLRVIDFGIAQAADNTAMTATGRVWGSPAYMSPEQAQGLGVGSASDVFSMGAVLAYAASGASPYGGGSAPEVLFRVVFHDPQLESLPASLRDLIARCMSKDPEQRPTARQFLAELPEVTHAGQARSPHIDWWPAAPPVPADSPGDAGGAPPEPGGAAAPDAGHEPGQAESAAQQRTVTIKVDRGEPARQGSRQAGDGRAGEGPADAGPTGEGSAQERHGEGRRDRPAWRRKWVAAAAASTVAVGAAAALLAVAPWKPGPLPRPSGLAAAAAADTAVSLHWLSPAAGSVPDNYEIVRDGRIVEIVGGGSTSYRDHGLAPAKTYRYQLIALSAGRHSPESAIVTVRTPTLSEARLMWDGPVAAKVVSVYPGNKKVRSENSGYTWSGYWTFIPSCQSGACNVALSGRYDGTDFATTLTRSGAAYSGTADLYAYENCSGTPLHDKLTIQVSVTGGDVQDGIWTVSSWNGSVRLNSTSAGCKDEMATSSVHGG